MKMNTHTLEQMFSLSGRVALVTGGTVGMGRACAAALAAAGATVVVADDADRIKDHGKLVPEGIAIIELDVRSEDAVNAAVAGVIAAHGGVDILVNAAVVNHNKPLMEITSEEWDFVQATNLKSGFFMAKAVIPSMQQRGGGRMISITTIGSAHPVLHGNGAYGPSRAGMNQFMRNLALDYAADHITANAVLPGAVVTETISAAMRPTGPGADPSRHPAGPGYPDDVAGLVLLLAGPAGRYISGQSIAVDGGFQIS